MSEEVALQIVAPGLVGSHSDRPACNGSASRPNHSNRPHNDASLIGDMMARPARLPGGRFKPDSVREKIRAAQLINRLQAHIFDGLELSMSQVRAIEILLRKCLPDLTKTEVQAEATHRYVAQLPDVLTKRNGLPSMAKGRLPCNENDLFSHCLFVQSVPDGALLTCGVSATSPTIDPLSPRQTVTLPIQFVTVDLWNGGKSWKICKLCRSCQRHKM